MRHERNGPRGRGVALIRRRTGIVYSSPVHLETEQEGIARSSRPGALPTSPRTVRILWRDRTLVRNRGGAAIYASGRSAWHCITALPTGQLVGSFDLPSRGYTHRVNASCHGAFTDDEAPDARRAPPGRSDADWAEPVILRLGRIRSALRRPCKPSACPSRSRPRRPDRHVQALFGILDRSTGLAIRALLEDAYQRRRPSRYEREAEHAPRVLAPIFARVVLA